MTVLLRTLVLFGLYAVVLAVLLVARGNGNTGDVGGLLLLSPVILAALIWGFIDGPTVTFDRFIFRWMAVGLVLAIASTSLASIVSGALDSLWRDIVAVVPLFASLVTFPAVVAGGLSKLTGGRRHRNASSQAAVSEAGK
jgi:hypothetical protein